MTREEILKHPAYWFEYEQNELYRQVMSYMENEKINQTELAERLKVSKGYISQILNGNFNYTLKKLIEISLLIGVVPRIRYDKIAQVIKDEKSNKNSVKGKPLEHLINEINELSQAEKLELSELMWNNTLPIPNEHQQLVLERIEKAKESPGRLVKLDSAFKTLETATKKKKVNTKNFSGAIKFQGDAVVLKRRLRDKE